MKIQHVVSFFLALQFIGIGNASAAYTSGAVTCFCSHYVVGKRESKIRVVPKFVRAVSDLQLEPEFAKYLEGDGRNLRDHVPMSTLVDVVKERGLQIFVPNQENKSDEERI